MKRLFILCIFIQWSAFGSDCDLTFDNKEPSRILEQMQAIDLMDAEKALICFNDLKSFLIEAVPDNINSTDVHTPTTDTVYDNPRQENLERIQYLMSLIIENQSDMQHITPQLHSEMKSENTFPIKVTSTKINQIQSITNKPLLSDETFSDLDQHVTKIQPQRQMPMLWNPIFPWTLPQQNLFTDRSVHAPANTNQETEIVNPGTIVEQTHRKPVEQKQIWKETIHIEFPSIVICRQPADEISQELHKAFLHYASEISDFTDSHPDIVRIYVNIVEWKDSVRNQGVQSLQSSYSLFDFSSYSAHFSQIPDFITNNLTSEQKESLAQIINLSSKHFRMYNLHFEYRKCLPKVFQEYLLISYSAPTPSQADTHSPPAPLSDIDLLYKLSVHTPLFASSVKQSYPLRMFRQSHIDWDDFSENDMRSRYEPEWDNTLQFLKNLILQNRNYLNVSF